MSTTTKTHACPNCGEDEQAHYWLDTENRPPVGRPEQQRFKLRCCTCGYEWWTRWLTPQQVADPGLR